MCIFYAVNIVVLEVLEQVDVYLKPYDVLVVSELDFKAVLKINIANWIGFMLDDQELV